MGKKKKPAKELTTEEAVKQIFPAKVINEIKKEAHKHDDEDNGRKQRRKTRKKKWSIHGVCVVDERQPCVKYTITN